MHLLLCCFCYVRGEILEHRRMGPTVVPLICWWPIAEPPRRKNPGSHYCVLWSGSDTQTQIESGSQDLPSPHTYVMAICHYCSELDQYYFFYQFSKILATEVIFPRTQKFRRRKITIILESCLKLIIFFVIYFLIFILRRTVYCFERFLETLGLQA